MTDHQQLDGLILICDQDGNITEIAQDSLGVTDSRLVGQPLSVLVLNESLRTAFNFWESLKSEQTSFDWGVYVRQRDQKLFLHFVGYAFDGRFVVIGAKSRVSVARLYHRTLKAHHDQLNARRAELDAAQSANAAREQEWQSRVSELSEKINTLQAALAKQEAVTTEPQDPRGKLVAKPNTELAKANERLQRELTECQSAQAALTKSEAALSAVFHASPAATVLIGRESSRIVSLNEGFAQIVGRAQTEIVGRSLADFLSRASQDAFTKAAGELSPHHPLKEIEVKFRKDTDSLRDGALALRLIEPPDGEPIIVGVLQDVTDQLHMTQSLTADLNASREQMTLLAEEMRQREYQHHLRAGALGEADGETDIESRLHRQREKEWRREIEGLRRMERERAEHIARLEADVERHKQMLMSQAPLLREQADLLEIALNERKRMEQARDAVLDQSKLREHELLSQIQSLRSHVDGLESRKGDHTEREQVLLGQFQVFREQANLREQDLLKQVTEARTQAAQFKLEAEHHKQTLLSQAPLLREQAELLEQIAAQPQIQFGVSFILEKAKQREQELAEQVERLREQLLEADAVQARVAALQEDNLRLETDLRHHRQTSDELAQLTQMLSARASALEAEIAQHVEAKELLARQLADLQQQSALREQSLDAQTTTLRDRAHLFEIELGRRTQRQLELTAQTEDLKETEQKLREEIARLAEQIAERDARLGEQAQREQSLLERIATHQQTEQETSAQLAALRGEIMLLELEIGRHKTNEHESNEQVEHLHQQVRALEVELKRRRQTEKIQLALVQEQTALREQALAAQVAALNEQTATLERALAENLQHNQDLHAGALLTQERIRLLERNAEALAQTEQALRQELSAMQQIEQKLRAQLAEVDRQARLLEWQVVEQAIAQPGEQSVGEATAVEAQAGAPTAPTAELTALNDFIYLALEMSDEPGLLKALVMQFAETTHAAGACMLVRDDARQTFIARELYGLYEDPAVQLPIGIDEINPDESALYAGHLLTGAEGVFSTLSLPLCARGETRGVALLTFDTAHVFSADEIARAEQLAGLLALAVSLARKHEQQKRALAMLRAQVEQLRQLSLRLAEGEESAQQHLAQKLQADVGHNLTMLSIYLDNLPNDLPLAGAAIVKARVTAYQSLVDEISRTVRDVVAELHPPLLDEDGLVAALRWYGTRFTERTGLPTTVRGEELTKRLAPDVERTLFRIAQEMLSNIEPSDPANPIRITFHDLGEKTQMCIAGEGAALKSATAWERFRIRERAEAVGGHLRLESAEGQPARLIVEVAQTHAVND